MLLRSPKSSNQSQQIEALQEKEIASEEGNCTNLLINLTCILLIVALIVYDNALMIGYFQRRKKPEMEILQELSYYYYRSYKYNVSDWPLLVNATTSGVCYMIGDLIS